MIEKREYVEEVERIAREALEAERESGCSAYDYAWEEVEWHRWVIYHAHAEIIPSLASADGTATLECMDLNAIYRDSGVGGLHSVIAFACMLEDVQARIDEMREAE